MGRANAYGLWTLVIINSLVFIVFALSFARPRTPRDWRSFGAFSGFIVALFAEMYGYPLTIYLLSGWLTTRFPGVDFLSHDAGHLLEVMFGWRANPHAGPFHVLSYAFIIGGFWLLASAWNVLYRSQREGELATTGAYAHMPLCQGVDHGTLTQSLRLEMRAWRRGGLCPLRARWLPADAQWGGD